MRNVRRACKRQVWVLKEAPTERIKMARKLNAAFRKGKAIVRLFATPHWDSPGTQSAFQNLSAMHCTTVVTERTDRACSIDLSQQSFDGSEYFVPI